jgi:hypothetical protein
MKNIKTGRKRKEEKNKKWKNNKSTKIQRRN